MTMIVGFAPDERGRAALQLATLLARSAEESLVVCAVTPQQWQPGLANVDAEYQAYLDEVARDALDEAQSMLPPDIDATLLQQRARSAPTGLLTCAAEHDACLIVLGSSSTGAFGRVALGSVTDRLLHSSPVPIALAPRGYRARAEAHVSRVTAAFGGSDGADDLLVAAADLSVRARASLRLASFAVRPRTPPTAGIGRAADAAILQQWVHDISEKGRTALATGSHPERALTDIDVVVGQGLNWDEAMEDVDWQDGDLLAVGSSSVGPVTRVFLGSRASKLLRHSPVPVVVVPRGAQAT